MNFERNYVQIKIEHHKTFDKRMFSSTRSIYQVSATDDDLEGTIVYGLTGLFPVQSFIDVNPSTGVVTLRNSLLSDSVQTTVYTVSTLLSCCWVEFFNTFPNNKFWTLSN